MELSPVGGGTWATEPLDSRPILFAVCCPIAPRFARGMMNYNLLAALHASDWVHYYDHNGSVYPCGNVPDGKTVCWDPYEETFVGPTPREVAAFSAGDDSACWLLPDRTVGCWGRIGSPEGTFQSVVVGGAVYRGFACGVRTNGELACWGGADTTRATYSRRRALSNPSVQATTQSILE